MRGQPILLFILMLLATVAIVVGENGVGDMSMRQQLNGAVVIEQLLLR